MIVSFRSLHDCLCYNFTRFLFFAVYTIFVLIFFCFPLIKNRSRKPLCIKAFGFGGEQGIRTLETLLTFTRFPIVLLRPARTTLRVCNQMLVYYIWPRRKNQVFFQKSWTFYFCTPAYRINLCLRGINIICKSANFTCFLLYCIEPGDEI